MAKLEDLYKEHKILERAEAMKKTILIAHTRNDEGELLRLFKKLDKLDGERVNYMTSAENHAGRPPPNGVYEWSPSLEETGRIITYWKLRLSVLQTPQTEPPRLLKMRKELGIRDGGRQDKVYVKEQLSYAWKN